MKEEGFQMGLGCIDHLGDSTQEDSHGSCPRALQSGQDPLNHQLIYSLHAWNVAQTKDLPGGRKACLSYGLMETPWLKAIASDVFPLLVHGIIIR